MRTNIILLLYVGILTACAPKNSNETGVSHLSESGTCSESFLSRLNQIEYDASLFKSYGLSASKFLLSAKDESSRILTEYGSISCIAIDRTSKKESLISNSTVQNLHHAIEDLLMKGYSQCTQASKKSPEEIEGCRLLQTQTKVRSD